MKNKKFAFILAAGWLMFTTLLFCTPGTRFPKAQWHDKIWLDKWVHVLLFLVLVFLWCLAYIRKTKKSFLLITILTISYGIIMELIQQYFIPFRYFDYVDMFANCAGSVAGYFISIKRFSATR